MKTLTLILFSIFHVSVTNCQNITFDQFVSLRTKSLTFVEEYLTSRNWEMLEAEDENEKSMGYAGFAYKKQSYDNKAESFITYFYSNEPYINNRLKIQLNTVKSYNQYMGRIKALGYKLLISKIENGNIIKIYQLNNNTVEITTSVLEDDFASKTVYTFFAWNSKDYKLVMLSDEE